MRRRKVWKRKMWCQLMFHQLVITTWIEGYNALYIVITDSYSKTECFFFSHKA